MHWLLHVLGADNGSGPFYLFGSGMGGMLTEVVVIGFLSWLAKRLFVRFQTRQHDQAERHHTERLALATDHHAEMRSLAEKHHRQALDHAAGLHEELKAHLTKTAADGPVRAGAGSNPARSEGLPADRPVVPPAAARNARKTTTLKGM